MSTELKIVIGLSVLLVGFCVYWDVKNYPSEPPPGWTIVTDGEVYKWVRPNGHMAVFSKRTKREAIRRAWGQYKFENEDQLEWKPVK